MELRVFAIDADSPKTVRAIMTEVAQVRHPLEQFRIGSDHCPTLDGVEQLGGVKAASRDVPVFEDRLPVDLDAKGMRPVIDDLKSMPVGNLLNGLHLTGNPIDVGGKDSGGLWRDGRFDLGRIEGKSVRQNVHKDRRAPFPHDA